MNDERLLREKPAAKYMDLSVRTLQAWRHRGGGPRFIRISSRCIRYRKSDLDEWLESRRVRSTSERTEVE